MGSISTEGGLFTLCDPYNHLLLLPHNIIQYKGLNIFSIEYTCIMVCHNGGCLVLAMWTSFQTSFQTEGDLFRVMSSGTMFCQLSTLKSGVTLTVYTCTVCGIPLYHPNI